MDTHILIGWNDKYFVWLNRCPIECFDNWHSCGMLEEPRNINVMCRIQVHNNNKSKTTVDRHMKKKFLNSMKGSCRPSECNNREKFCLITSGCTLCKFL